MDEELFFFVKTNQMKKTQFSQRVCPDSGAVISLVILSVSAENIASDIIITGSSELTN